MDRRQFVSCAACGGAALGTLAFTQAANKPQAQPGAVQDRQPGPCTITFYRHNGTSWMLVDFADLRPGDKVICVETGPTLLVECWEVAGYPSAFLAGPGPTGPPGTAGPIGREGTAGPPAELPLFSGPPGESASPPAAGAERAFQGPAGRPEDNQPYHVPYIKVDWTASLLPQLWGVPPHTRAIIAHPSPDQREIQP